MTINGVVQDKRTVRLTWNERATTDTGTTGYQVRRGTITEGNFNAQLRRARRWRPCMAPLSRWISQGLRLMTQARCGVPSTMSGPRRSKQLDHLGGSELLRLSFGRRPAPNGVGTSAEATLMAGQRVVVTDRDYVITASVGAVFIYYGAVGPGEPHACDSPGTVSGTLWELLYDRRLQRGRVGR